jgi:hypothetical protein
LSLARSNLLQQWRREELDAAGIVWDPRDEEWERKLALLRDYHAVYGHMAPRQNTIWRDEPVGQLLHNLRRPAGLGKDPDRAQRRADQLAAIDPDWNCPWSLDWQRPYAVLRDLANADGVLPQIAPGVLHDGDDLGRWLERQAQDWKTLSPEQQHRLSQLGIKPADTISAPPAVRRKGAASNASFQLGVQALRQYVERKGIGNPVPRQHVEAVQVEGQAQPIDQRTGVWLSNTKSRRGKLTPEQRADLAELGVEWA